MEPLRIKTTSLGISLVLLGVPLGMYLNYFLGNVNASVFTMTLSIAFLLFKEKMSFYIKKDFKLILLFQIFMLFYWSLSNNSTTHTLVFHLYILALILSLSNVNRINGNEVLLYTFVLSSILTIVGIYLDFNNLIVGDEAWLLRQDNKNYTLEAFTVSSGALTGYYAGLIINKNSVIKKLVVFFFLLADFYLIWACGKRTPLILLIICTIIYLFKKSQTNNITSILSVSIKVILLGYVLVSILLLNQTFQDEFVKQTTNIYNGVLNILGNKDVSDMSGSAIFRYKLRMILYDFMQNNFNILNYVLGYGYMGKWEQIDNPILQSYFDMGIIGLIGYCWLVVLYPLKSLFRRNMNNLQLFFVFCCLYNVFSSISSGNPYMYIKYTTVCLLIFSFEIKKGNMIYKCNSLVKN